MLARASAVGLLVAAALGCTLRPIDVTGRRCPCIEGWVCDRAEDVCVPEGTLDDAGASRDAASLDAGDDQLDGGAIEDAGAGSDRDAELDGGSDGGIDGGIDAGPSGCALLPTAALCEDFEAGSLSRWSISASAGASAETTTSTAHAGRGALRLLAPGPGGSVSVSVPVSAPAGAEIHLRAWLRVGVGATGRIRPLVLESVGRGAASAELAPMPHALVARLAPVGSTEASASGMPNAWSDDAWTCLRARVVVGDVTVGTIELYDAAGLDVALTGAATDLGGAYDRLAIEVTAGSDDSELVVDDVAWSSSPLPCE